MEMENDENLIVFDNNENYEFNRYDEVDDLDEPDQYVDDELLIDAEVIPTAGDQRSDEEDNEATDTRREKSTESRLINLPLGRIKLIMKTDPDTNLIANEAIFAVTKATELFIDALAKESFKHTAQSKKRTVQKRDVDLAISTIEPLMFLDGAMNF